MTKRRVFDRHPLILSRGTAHLPPIECGQRFGRLVVLARGGAYKHSDSLWLCRCDCGDESEKRGTYLRKGILRACKNCVGAHIAATHTTHGETPRARSGNRSSLYNIWSGMRSRCGNPRNDDWKTYGGKGVVVHGPWHDFSAFRDWALTHGYQPGLTLDREDSDGNYEPSNCEWVTREENSRRVRTSFARKAVEADRRLRAWSDDYCPEALMGWGG